MYIYIYIICIYIYNTQVGDLLAILILGSETRMPKGSISVSAPAMDATNTLPKSLVPESFYFCSINIETHGDSAC